MGHKYVIYNPYAGNGKCKSDVDKLKDLYNDCCFVDVRKVSSYTKFLTGLEADDEIIICGGDGTLNRFANDIKGIQIKNKIYYYAVGSGNDFVRDIGKAKGDEPTFSINEFLEELPTVNVNGEDHLFLNGIGYGIDGYCCEVGDALREENQKTHSDKPINYTSIAIKGLLFHYKPTNAKITVDGNEYNFKKVWLAPTMNGRYYGGGMMPTPDQDRLGENKQVSLMVLHGTGKLRTLMIFPSIFNGGHVKNEKHVSVLSGKEIKVEFDRPTPLQIDGETVLGVTSYTVKSYGVSENAEKNAISKAV